MWLHFSTTTMSTVSSSTNVNIPSELSADVQEWDDEDVGKFLMANQKKYQLKESHIDVIKNQEVSGMALLDLTDEKLEKWGVSGESAIAIAKLVDRLKKAKGLIELGK